MGFLFSFFSAVKLLRYCQPLRVFLLLSGREEQSTEKGTVPRATLLCVFFLSAVNYLRACLRSVYLSPAFLSLFVCKFESRSWCRNALNCLRSFVVFKHWW